MRKSWALLVALVLGIGVLAWAGPAQAVETTGPFKLPDNATGKCLGIGNASRVNGAAAIQWTCAHQPGSDQAWTKI